MGCTSSTPNMTEITADTNENTENDKNSIAGNVKEDDDGIHNQAPVEGGTKNTNDSQVLPTCDSLEENIQLARNSNSFTKINNEEQEHEHQSTSVLEKEEVENEDHNEHKLSLKEIADQILLQNIFDDIDQQSDEHEETNNNKGEDVPPDTKNNLTESIEAFTEEQLDNAEEQEINEESTSPSQSDGNRSTRWEALADIAAELPPSLAVDPVTGQIYSLTK